MTFFLDYWNGIIKLSDGWSLKIIVTDEYDYNYNYDVNKWVSKRTIVYENHSDHKEGNKFTKSSSQWKLNLINQAHRNENFGAFLSTSCLATKAQLRWWSGMTHPKFYISQTIVFKKC